MFGHQDDKDDKSSHDDTTTAPAIAPDTTDDTQDTQPTDQGADYTAHTGDSEHTATGTQDFSPTATDSAPDNDNAWQHPGVPLDEGPEHITDIIAPAGGNSTPSFKPHHPSSFDEHGSQDDSNVPHELIEIKQKALSKLTPLIDQLDQSPEDKFRTTMMMIQASDDQSLVKLAYEAANAIEDEKARAQALLDIVNEINYFTHHPES